MVASEFIVKLKADMKNFVNQVTQGIKAAEPQGTELGKKMGNAFQAEIKKARGKEKEGIAEHILATGRGGGMIVRLIKPIAKGMAVMSAINIGIDQSTALLGKISKHSEIFATTLNLMYKSFEFFIKPIADIFGLFLMPFAVMMLKWGAKFYKKAFQWYMDEDKRKTIKQMGVGAVAGAGVGAVGGGVIGGLLGGIPGAMFGMKIGMWVGGVLGALMPLVVKGLKNLGIIAWEWIKQIGIWVRDGVIYVGRQFEKIYDTIRLWVINAYHSVKEWITEKLGVEIVTWLQGIWDSIVELGDKIAGFSVEIWDFVTGAPREIWYWVKGSTKSIWDWISTATKDIWDWITTSVKSVWEWILTPIRSIWDFIVGGRKPEEAGDFILQPGGRLIKTDPTDFIFGTKTPETLLGGGGGIGTQNINVTINANVSSDYDVRELAEKIADYAQESMRRRISF